MSDGRTDGWMDWDFFYKKTITAIVTTVELEMVPLVLFITRTF
jgi:hypothetical protein